MKEIMSLEVLRSESTPKELQKSKMKQYSSNIGVNYALFLELYQGDFRTNHGKNKAQ
jgi:hypothetical protein